MLSKELMKVVQADISMRWSAIEVENYVNEKSYLSKQLEVMDSIAGLYEYEKANGIESTIALIEKMKEKESEEYGLGQKVVRTSAVLEIFHESDYAKAVRAPLGSREPKVVEGVFKREIRDGLLIVEGEQIYVPESIVRALGLENGNRVRGTEKIGDSQPNGKPKYDFEKLNNETTEPEVKRYQFNECVVKEAGGCYYVDYSKQTNQSIKVGEDFCAPTLNQDDVWNYSLKVGSMIDIAFLETSKNQATCLWKH